MDFNINLMVPINPFGIYVVHALAKVRQCMSQHGHRKNHQKMFNYSMNN